LILKDKLLVYVKTLKIKED